MSVASLGAQWEYQDSERRQITALFDYLESRRALWVPFNSEDNEHVITSVLAIRERLTTLQESLPQRSPARPQVRKLRLVCERFLSDARPGRSQVTFYSNLGELRGAVGVYLEDLATAYEIDVHPPLSWTLPSHPSAAADVPGRSRAAGEIVRSVYYAGPDAGNSPSSTGPDLCDPNRDDDPRTPRG